MTPEQITQRKTFEANERRRIKEALNLEKEPNLKIITRNREQLDFGPEPLPNGMQNEALAHQLSPEETYIYHYAEQFFGEQGKGYDLTLLQGKNVMSPVPFVGWGHLVQSAELTQTFANVTGTNVYMFDPMDMLTPTQQRPYALIQQFLKVMHTGGDMGKFIDSVDSGVTSLGDRAFFGMAKALMRITLGGAGFTSEDDPNLLSKVSKNVVNAIGKNRTLAGAVLQGIVFAEKVFSEQPFADVIYKLIEHIEPDLIMSSHSATIRSLDTRNKKIQRPGISFIPDPGYFAVMSEIVKGLDPNDPESRDFIKMFQLIVPFAPMSLTFARRQDNLVFTVPNAQAKHDLEQMYNPNAHIVSAGTITGSIEPLDFCAKWNSPEKTVLLSSNGNGSNIPTIYSALRDFVNADENLTASFKLTVFLGEHNDERIGKDMLDLLAVIQNDANLRNKIKVVRTDNRLDTAIQKNHETKQAHVQIRTGGENAMDNGNMGCASVNTWNDAENEQGNVYFMMQKGAAIPSAWPPADYKRWKEKLEPILRAENKTIPHFENAEENFVSYMQKLFNEEHIAQKVATSGYLNLDNLSNMHMIMIMIQQMLNRISPKQPDHYNRITEEQLTDIENFMQPLREKWAQARRQVLEEHGLLDL